MDNNKGTSTLQERAGVIVGILEGAGLGEVVARCLSLGADGATRCKAKSKDGCLFCTTHSNSGAIASPELKAAYQLNQGLLKPLMVAAKAPGGVYETKAAREAAKAKSAAPKQAHKVEANMCKKTNGQKCTVPTRNTDGYCHHHRAQVPKADVPKADDQEEEEQEVEAQEPIFFAEAPAAPVQPQTKSRAKDVPEVPVRLQPTRSKRRVSAK